MGKWKTYLKQNKKTRFNGELFIQSSSLWTKIQQWIIFRSFYVSLVLIKPSLNSQTISSELCVVPSTQIMQYLLAQEKDLLLWCQTKSLYGQLQKTANKF